MSSLFRRIPAEYTTWVWRFAIPGQKFEAVKVLEDNMRYLDQSAEAHFVLGHLYRERRLFHAGDGAVRARDPY